MLQRDRGAQGQGTSLSQGLAQVGHSLRRARVSQGLAIQDAARAAGLTVDDAQALETGDPSRMPDQVHTVNLLRRYAQSLGLPADRYALALLDAWPTAAPRPGPAPRPVADPQPAAPAPAPRPAADPEGGSTWVGDQPTGMLQSTNGTPVGRDQDHGTTGVYPAYDPAGREGPPPEESSPGGPATGDTGPTRVTRSIEAPGNGPATVMTPADTGPVAVSVLDTGSTPAVHTRSSTVPARSRRGGLILLRLTVALMLILVIAGGAALAIHHWRPQWLRSLEKNSTNPPASTAATQNTAAASGASITQNSLSTTSATITVHGTNPKVSVSAVGGPSWVEVKAPGQSNPIFAADIESGSQKTFDVQSSLQIQVGSSAARLAVSVDHSPPHTYAPATAPFTYTFTVD